MPIRKQLFEKNTQIMAPQFDNDLILGDKNLERKGVPSACRRPGSGSSARERAGRHHPVSDRLLDVLQRLAGEDRAVRIGMEEAGRDADEQTTAHRRASVSMTRGAHRVAAGFIIRVTSPPRKDARSGRPSKAADWSDGTCRRPRSRPSRGTCSLRTPADPRFGAMPIACFSSFSQGTNACAAALQPDRVRELVELGRHGLAWFQASTVSIISALASPWCRSHTVPSACAQEWTAPRSFWNAIAPIIELVVDLGARRSFFPQRAALTAGRGGVSRSRCGRTPGGRPRSRPGWRRRKVRLVERSTVWVTTRTSQSSRRKRMVQVDSPRDRGEVVGDRRVALVGAAAGHRARCRRSGPCPGPSRSPARTW